MLAHRRKNLLVVFMALFLTAGLSITIPSSHSNFVNNASTQFYASDTYNVTIQAWDSVAGWQSVSIAVDGHYNTGWTTPHTFVGLDGTHTFAVPSTDNKSTPFTQWDTGETTLYISVNSSGTHTAQYWVPYNVTIQAWDSAAGVQHEPIQVDGVDTGYNTTYTFLSMTGTNTFAVPWVDNEGTEFTQWNTGETSAFLTVSSGGTYTAQYYQSGTYNVTIWAWDSDRGYTSEPILIDNESSGYNTPHTFTNLISTHNFTVPSVDSWGTPFTDWTTGEITPTIIVSQGGNHTAEYYSSGVYNVTIQAWDPSDRNGWIIEPIVKDGYTTSFSTPYTFTHLGGTHFFTVPSTDVDGNPFGNWSTGGTSTSIMVNSSGTYTAQYYPPYNVTIWAWDNGTWEVVPITMDGVSTGFSTPYTFTGLDGTHNFTVPATAPHGDPFMNWSTGELSTTLTVNSGGTYTAQYYYPAVPEFQPSLLLPLFMVMTLLGALIIKRKRINRDSST